MKNKYLKYYISLSIIILISTYIALNTHIINKKCESHYSLALQSLNNPFYIPFRYSKNAIFQNKNTEQTQKDIIKNINELNKIKKYILDGNSISYLFQIISILLIGIGAIMLQKNADLKKEIQSSIITQKENNKKLSKKLKNETKKYKLEQNKIILSNNIYNKTQLIFLYSSLLKKTEDNKPTTNSYNHITGINTAINDINSIFEINVNADDFIISIIESSVKQLRDSKRFITVLGSVTFYDQPIKDIIKTIRKLEQILA